MVQIGIGAGFASVFGTPLAGAVFALEVIIVGRMRYDAILPIFLASFFANYACHAWGIKHTVYSITQVPELGVDVLLWVLLASVFFGLTARLFSRSIEFWSPYGQEAHILCTVPSPVGGYMHSLMRMDYGNHQIYRSGRSCYCKFIL